MRPSGLVPPMPRPRRGHRRRRRAWILVALGALLLAVGAATYRVVQIAGDLRAAKQGLETAERELKAGRPAAARRAVDSAHRRVTHANNVIHGQTELTLLKLLPVARQNLDAIERSVAVALQITTGGQRLLAMARPLEAPDGKFEVPMRSGAVPLPVIKSVRPQLRELASSLPSVSERPDSPLLVSPVKDMVDSVFRQAQLRRQQAGTLAQGLELLTELSGGNGPRRFMIAVANAAEMRGTGGMILSYGELVAADGRFTLENFGGFEEIALPAPAAADAPKDYLDHYAPLGPTFEWRNANLASDFSHVGGVMEAMYRKATGKRCDGVIQIDSMGLAAMMRGTGPVDVPGLGRVAAGNVVRVTLSDAYARFPDRTVRQEVLGDVAEAVFRRLVTGDYPSLRPLATALITAVAERRIMLHMASGAAQRNVIELGADGALPATGRDFAYLAVQNFAANKLDYYLDTALRLAGQRRAGRPGRVRAEITLTNTAPPGRTQPAYVFGPFNRSFRAGEYVGQVTLALPPGSVMAGPAQGLAEQPVVFTEGGRTVVGFSIRVDAGTSKQVALDLALPPVAASGYRFELVPASRVRPTMLTLDLERGPGRIRWTGPLQRIGVVAENA